MNKMPHNIATGKAFGLLLLICGLCLVAGLVSAGCSNDGPASRPTGEGEGGDASTPAVPQIGKVRAASVVPSVTELIAAMGCADQLVGRGRYCQWPPEILHLPVIGDYVTLNHERLIVLQPDLLILNTSDVSKVRQMSNFGIRVIAPRMETVDDVYQVIDLLGTELGAPQKAAALAAELRADLAEVTRSVRARSADDVDPTATPSEAPEPVRVLIAFPDLKGGAQVQVVGRDTFVNELLELAGGSNVVSNSGYVMLSMEAVANLDPQVIIISAPGDMGINRTDDQYQAAWSRWKNVPAVRDNRIFVLRQPYLTLPGPRMALAAKLLADTLRRPSADSAPQSQSDAETAAPGRQSAEAQP